MPLIFTSPLVGAILHSDYNEPGTLCYEEAAKVMVRMKLKSSEIKEFYRRMVFIIICFLISTPDKIIAINALI